MRCSTSSRRSSTPAGASTSCDARAMSSSTDVDFAYARDGPLVLDDLNLHLQPGETVAMVGRTASGKTTVATAALALLRRHRRRRQDRRPRRPRRRRSRASAHQIGVVLDEPFLFSVSIRDNIAYGRPDAPLEEIEAAARAAGAERVHRRAARRLRHDRRRARLHALRRSAPAHRDRADAARQPADPGARRRHQRRRRAGRAGDPRGPEDADARAARR